MFWFSNYRPVNGDGYEIREMVVSGTKKRELALVRKKNAPFCSYDALNEETGLFRIFADVDPTPEGCLAFANAFGALGWRATRWTDSGPEMPERVPLWQALILQMRYLVRLFDLLQAGDEQELSRFVESRDGAFFLRELPILCDLTGAYQDAVQLLPQPDEHGCADSGITIEGKMVRRTFLDVEGRPWRMKEWHGIEGAGIKDVARMFFTTCLNDLLDEDVHCEFDLHYHTKRLEFGVHPRDFMSAFLLQFAFAITGNKKYQKCPSCGRWFELQPGLNRANKVTCSQSCRTRAYRQRQDRARELKANGKTVRAIAKELGSNIETVKGWLTPQKE